MKFILLLLVIAMLYSCSKEPIPLCKQAWYISEKYSSDEVYIKTDTLWHDQVCGRWIDTIRVQKPGNYTMCVDGSKEITYYILK